MARPALLLQTVAFDDSDRADAARLGEDLYGHLTRPLDDPLGHGAGIPVLSAVSPERIDTASADVLVLVPVLGQTTLSFERERVIETVHGWHEELGAGHILPVLTAPAWRGVEDQMPGLGLATELYGAGDRRRRTLDELVLGMLRLLVDDDEQMQLFVSHARADLQPTDDAAAKIHEYVTTDTTGRSFFDARHLLPGHDFERALAEASGKGLLIAVRGDAYASRAWCQRELLTAKRHGLPTLTVEILRRGEPRSAAYGGNAPSIVWEGGPEPVVSRAMVECLRAAAFKLEARRVIDAAELPADTTVLCRPPELLDLAQGPLHTARSQVALHPDPELPVIEREVLRHANPRLRLVTPTTAFRAVLADSAPANPLDGIQVAMSLSQSPDVGGDEGFTEHHVRDATIYLARSLISAGAAIAYGGDFRENGYSELLAELITTYNQTASEPADLLHSYLGAPIESGALPDGVLVTGHHLGRAPFSERAILPDPSVEDHPAALYFSDMRRVMAEDTEARVLLGGQAAPQIGEDGSDGYGGRYPGVVEEAWRALQVGNPLYPLGGFGGAAALVCRLLEDEEIPEELRDATWLVHQRFRERADAIDADPYRERLGLPGSMDDLAAAVRELGSRHLIDDDSAKAWNGLDLEQNRALFRSRDPVTVASLVIQGLLALRRRRAEGKLRIELVRGTITAAHDLDAVAVGAFDDLPLGGAGAELDRALAGRASMARARGHALMNLESRDIDASWLHLASLGKATELDHLGQRIADAARETATLATRHGFRRLGVVAFGGNVLDDTDAVVRAMLDGLSPIAGDTTLVWVEQDAERYASLRRQLRQLDAVSLTTRDATALPVVPPPAPEQVLFLNVVLEGGWLETTALPPAGTGMARTHRVALAPEQLDELCCGRGKSKRRTPKLDDLARRGRHLGELLFGADAAMLLARCRDASITVVHDLGASQLPYEILLAEVEDDGPIRPATGSGLTRRLAVRGLSVDQLLGKPPQAGSLSVAMVINPTQDLDGAEEEAAVVRKLLEQSPSIHLTELHGDQATRDAVLAVMAQADVLHYSGHAFFVGATEDDSGLVLADGDLTLRDLRDRSLSVRLAFVNACESARVRGDVETEAAAFAEMFLRSGIEAYLGTFWLVSDAGAASFAAQVYGRLANGERLDTAVRLARATLLEEERRDWGNYLLYGDGRFRLVQS